MVVKQRSKQRICFVSPYSYPLFNPDYNSPFGGSEVRVALIAKELAQKDLFDVNLIVFDHGQPHVELRQGVRLYSLSGRRCPLSVVPVTEAFSPLPVLRTFQERIRPYCPPWLWRIERPLYYSGRRGYRIFNRVAGRAKRFRYEIRQFLRQGGRIGSHAVDAAFLALYRDVSADLYITHGNNATAADLAFYCKKRHKPFLLLSGSDEDFNPGILLPSQGHNNYGVPAFLMRYTIENAQGIVVQNQTQVELLRNHFHRASVLIRNPVDLTRRFLRHAEPKTILWVGKSDSVKRPELVLDLASTLPEYHFEMIMNFSNPEIHERCVQRARQLPNVTLHTYVPFPEVEGYFASAGLLLSTSLFEGFPNTFLQAAKYAVPIVSFQLDPGKMLSEYNSGMVCGGDADRMRQAILVLMNQPEQYRSKSESGREYVRRFHAKEKIIEQYAEVMTSLVCPTGRGGGFYVV